MPVGQAADALVFHRGQQRLALRALLEAVDGGQVVEQERQVEDLHLFVVVLELGQRRRQHLHIAQQQGFHFLAVTEQRRVGVDLDFDLVLELRVFGDQLLEHQRALAFGRTVGHHVGELDDDRVGGLGQARHGHSSGAEQRVGQLQHRCHL
ncbi:hypothetical protein D3C76_1342970 [compost metagenome]